MLQPNNRSSSVYLPNCNTHAKFERVLLVIYRDIHRFINVVYYSRVDDTSKTSNLHVVKNLDISKTKQDIKRLKTPLRLVRKCCSDALKTGSTIFRRSDTLKSSTKTKDLESNIGDVLNFVDFN